MEHTGKEAQNAGKVSFKHFFPPLYFVYAYWLGLRVRVCVSVLVNLHMREHVHACRAVEVCLCSRESIYVCVGSCMKCADVRVCMLATDIHIRETHTIA